MTTKIAWIKRKERYGKTGFKNPKERRRKISENTKKALAKPEIKAKIIADRKRRKEKYGYINSPETRKKISEIWKKKWANGEVTEKQRQNLIICRKNSKKTQFKKGHKVPEKWRKAVRESRAKQIIPMRNSSIEVKIQNFLKSLHIEFLAHYYISNINHKYQCDIFIPSKNLIIETDGCYWHGCKTCNKKISTFQLEQIEEDKIRTKELLKKGYNVIRLWEHDIKKMELNDFEVKL